MAQRVGKELENSRVIDKGWRVAYSKEASYTWQKDKTWQHITAALSLAWCALRLHWTQELAPRSLKTCSGPFLSDLVFWTMSERVLLFWTSGGSPSISWNRMWSWRPTRLSDSCSKVLATKSRFESPKHWASIVRKRLLAGWGQGNFWMWIVNFWLLRRLLNWNDPPACSHLNVHTKKR